MAALTPLPIPAACTAWPGCRTILRFGIQLFLGLTFLALAIALPINMTGGQVS